MDHGEDAVRVGGVGAQLSNTPGVDSAVNTERLQLRGQDG